MVGSSEKCNKKFQKNPKGFALDLILRKNKRIFVLMVFRMCCLKQVLSENLWELLEYILHMKNNFFLKNGPAGWIRREM